MAVVPADGILADAVVAIRSSKADFIPGILQVISDLLSDLEETAFSRVDGNFA